MDFYLNIINQEISSTKENLQIIYEDLKILQQEFHKTGLNLKNTDKRKYYTFKYLEEKCLINSRKIKILYDRLISIKKEVKKLTS